LAVQSAQIELTGAENLYRTSLNGTEIPLANRIQVEKARLTLKTVESKKKEAAAKLKGLEDELKALDEQLDFYVLRAPIAGRLGAIQVVPGQTLAIGATVADVVDLDAIDVLCFVPPYTSARLALRQAAPLAPYKADTPANGKVEFIAVQAQPDTGSFAVKVRFPNADLRLRGGSVLRIEVLTRPEQARVTIPESALLEDQDPPTVVIVADLHKQINEETKKEEDVGTAQRVRAIIGIRDRRWHVVELLGLEDPKKKEQVPINDQLQFVVKGGHGLEDGDKVKLEVDED